jgi:hypothetical protein
MDQSKPGGHQQLKAHWSRLLDKGHGRARVLATATLDLAGSREMPAAGRPAALVDRAARVRRQASARAAERAPAEAESPFAWGNWHNWRNGWPNGWHNWHNWRNWW